MWRLKTYGSLIKFRENKLYVTSASDDDHVMVERKNYDDEDYMDEEIECTVDSVSTYVDAELGTLSEIEVTWPASSAGNVDFVPTSGCIFRKTPSSLPWSKIREASEVEGSVGKYILRLSHYMPGLTTGTGVIGRSIPVILTWHEEIADNAAMLKNFSFAQLYFEDAKISRARLGFLADTETTEYKTDDLLVESTEDTTTCFRTIVPHTHAVCRGLRLKFLHSVAQEPWDLLQRSLEFRPLTWISGQSPR
jgi:hypothetical protein